MTAVAAVDLGAESGRVMLATIGADSLSLAEVHRFRNGPVRVLDTLHWDVLRLFEETVTGLRDAARRVSRLDSVGIDSWGVDYGLLDAAGRLVGNPVHYRDSRTDGVMPGVVAELGADRLYRTTGLQLLPFNTLFQLVAAGAGQLAAADRLLMIPDLLSYWLTGEAASELTNASTSQLLDARTRTWATSLIQSAGLPIHLFGPLRVPGEPAGRLRDELGLGPVPVTAVGSHDTASAVVAVPMEDAERAAYISCGTWSLVGVELDAPVLTEASRLANFTNEAGVDGTVRYLRNVMGLWLLQESVRGWRERGEQADLATLLVQAAGVPGLAAVVDALDPGFVPPGDLPARITGACRDTGQPPPTTPAATVRCIVDSLALAHRSVVRRVQQLTGRSLDVVHLVGGGARNQLLCQLTADACRLPVVAGPFEATAIGNALVQARALGAAGDDLPALRQLVRRTQPLRRYQPEGDEARWREAAARIGVED